MLHWIWFTAAEAGRTSSQYEADQRKLRALNRYYRRFGEVCCVHCVHSCASYKVSMGHVCLEVELFLALKFIENTC